MTAAAASVWTRPLGIISFRAFAARKRYFPDADAGLHDRTTA